MKELNKEKEEADKKIKEEKEKKRKEEGREDESESEEEEKGGDEDVLEGKTDLEIAIYKQKHTIKDFEKEIDNKLKKSLEVGWEKLTEKQKEK